MFYSILRHHKICSSPSGERETSYGIAKKYNIDLNVFFEFNTSASKGLNRGEYVKIPILVKSDTSLLSSDSLQSARCSFGRNIMVNCKNME